MREGYCKKSVASMGGWDWHQCPRRIWRDGFCKQHHPDSVKARREKSDQHYEEKRKQSCWYKLQQAEARLEKAREALGIAYQIISEYEMYNINPETKRGLAVIEQAIKDTGDAG